MDIIRGDREQDMGLRISVGTCFDEGFGVSAAWAIQPGEIPSIQKWAIGTDLLSDCLPSLLLEGSLPHVLRLAEDILSKGR